MAEDKLIIPIALLDKNIELHIFGDKLIEKSDAIDNGEAPFQILEGYNYEYKITEGYCLQSSAIVSQSKVNKSSGFIAPNVYVGTLTVDVLDYNKIKCGEVKIEVQSVKTTYREDYRLMLEEITEKCTDLLLQHSSPVSQYFETDFCRDAETAYQRFAFVKSIIDSSEFSDSINKIISSPVNDWAEIESVKDIRSIKRFTNSALRQIKYANNRVEIPIDHQLKSVLKSIPSKISVTNKTESVDTLENRFVKFVLSSFQSFFNDVRTKSKENSRINIESKILEDKLAHFQSHSLFKKISPLTTLPLNSTVLQRKEGYREILKVWLMFDLAAKMVWHGGNDVYSGNKKDVAVLYEYWLFFKLLDIIKEVFKINSLSIEKLIEQTSDGLGLKLRQGRFLPLEGVYVTETRKLRIEFSYNKTFSGNRDYPSSGSWTRNLRPDYTLSIWPLGIEQKQAEHEELIVHIHFDAKYKIENLESLFGKEKDLDEEKEEQKKGIYKRADLLKMHTYRDAIRRTAGAYILYPGTISDMRHGFHELLPGLGAFAIRPSNSNNDTDDVKMFLKDVINHFLNRASQREKISLKTYETFKESRSDNLNESLPEAFGPNRGLIPDETYVLVAYYKKRNWDWIINRGLYNARAGNNRGSLKLGPREAGAKYLLLHTEGEPTTDKLLKITETGPRVFSKKILVDNGYPTNPSQPFYLVYRVELVQDEEFLNQSWDITKLEGYKKGAESVLPFAITLTELMKAKKR